MLIKAMENLSMKIINYLLFFKLRNGSPSKLKIDHFKFNKRKIKKNKKKYNN